MCVASRSHLQHINGIRLLRNKLPRVDERSDVRVVDNVGERHDGWEVRIEKQRHRARRQTVQGGMAAGTVARRLYAVPSTKAMQPKIYG